MSTSLTACISFQLGSQITESKANLENALELAKGIHRDIPALNQWMDMVESELDEREALPDASRDMESEKAFLQVNKQPEVKSALAKRLAIHPKGSRSELEAWVY